MITVLTFSIFRCLCWCPWIKSPWMIWWWTTSPWTISPPTEIKVWLRFNRKIWFLDFINYIFDSHKPIQNFTLSDLPSLNPDISLHLRFDAHLSSLQMLIAHQMISSHLHPFQMLDYLKLKYLPLTNLRYLVSILRNVPD